MKGKFKKDSSKATPGIQTSSLPDVVFMLLFFFMVATVMRETTPLVQTRLPQATEVERLERRSLVSTINIGRPMRTEVFGTAPRIQLDDSFAEISDIARFVENERSRRIENLQPHIIWSLKVDKETRMGIVTDVKQELRKVHAYRINYSTFQRAEN